jgi:hypothetical protein
MLYLGWTICWSEFDSRCDLRWVIEVEGGMSFVSNCRRAAKRMARLLKLDGMLARTEEPCRVTNLRSSFPAYVTDLLPIDIPPS